MTREEGSCRTRRNAAKCLCAAALFTGCGGGVDERPRAGTDVPAGPASVAILEPVEGAELATTDVPVRLSAAGIRIAPAAVHEPGTAHHHLFLDLDVTPPGEKIPAGKTGIIHLGKGDSTFTFRAIAPGTHRLIAVLADSAHVPLAPPATDTIRFTVSGGS